MADSSGSQDRRGSDRRTPDHIDVDQESDLQTQDPDADLIDFTADPMVTGDPVPGAAAADTDFGPPQDARAADQALRPIAGIGQRTVPVRVLSGQFTGNPLGFDLNENPLQTPSLYREVPVNPFLQTFSRRRQSSNRAEPATVDPVPVEEPELDQLEPWALRLQLDRALLQSITDMTTVFRRQWAQSILLLDDVRLQDVAAVRRQTALPSMFADDVTLIRDARARLEVLQGTTEQDAVTWRQRLLDRLEDLMMQVPEGEQTQQIPQEASRSRAEMLRVLRQTLDDHFDAVWKKILSVIEEIQEQFELLQIFRGRQNVDLARAEVDIDVLMVAHNQRTQQLDSVVQQVNDRLQRTVNHFAEYSRQASLRLQQTRTSLQDVLDNCSDFQKFDRFVQTAEADRMAFKQRCLQHCNDQLQRRLNLLQTTVDEMVQSLNALGTPDELKVQLDFYRITVPELEEQIRNMSHYLEQIRRRMPQNMNQDQSRVHHQVLGQLREQIQKMNQDLEGLWRLFRVFQDPDQATPRERAMQADFQRLETRITWLLDMGAEWTAPGYTSPVEVALQDRLERLESRMTDQARDLIMLNTTSNFLTRVWKELEHKRPQDFVNTAIGGSSSSSSSSSSNTRPRSGQSCQTVSNRLVKHPF